MIKRLLIANRGEIAVRIIRTCKQMGIESVAVYSSADDRSLHVQLADYAVCIGGPRSSDSYLNMRNIISAACMTGCDAIHPGFGFLSENTKFAKLVRQSGLIFIGPDPEIIEAMGDKANAREAMIKAGVPVVPGSKSCIDTIETALHLAKEIGYPVMIKAANGGGGRGMRLAYGEADLPDAFEAAKSEAKIAFGDDQVYLEKYIIEPKHVEVQLVADHYGNVIHLYERDCSAQRHHQKVMEEAPCHTLQKQMREALFADAIKACKAVGYNSVGTIEFLVDQRGTYYFMEMNTRIQVEHTISEMITGLDLIKLQIRIADGMKLNMTQEDIPLLGHAVECRINAENIQRDFAPSPGTISFINFPGGRNVRVDTGVYNGYTISPYYDSMILKLICFGSSRLDAIKTMRAALEELIIEGVSTNIEFQYLLLHHPRIVSGRYDTGFMDIFLKELKEDGTIIQEA